MAIFEGNFSIAKKPSLVIPYSAPGISLGTIGLPPVAIQMCFAAYLAFPLPSSRSTSSSCGPVNFAVPWTRSMPSRFQLERFISSCSLLGGQNGSS